MGLRGPRAAAVSDRIEAYTEWEPNTGCGLWTSTLDRAGYGRLGINKKMRLVHRLVWEMANGPIPAGLHVLHRCDTPSCLNIKHLFLGTQQDNMADKVAKDRQLKGEANGNAKLTEAQVREIRTSQETLLALADKFGVSQMTVFYAKHGKTWKHLQEKEL